MGRRRPRCLHVRAGGCHVPGKGTSSSLSARRMPFCCKVLHGGQGQVHAGPHGLRGAPLRFVAASPWLGVAVFRIPVGPALDLSGYCQCCGPSVAVLSYPPMPEHEQQHRGSSSEAPAVHRATMSQFPDLHLRRLLAGTATSATSSSSSGYRSAWLRSWCKEAAAPCFPFRSAPPEGSPCCNPVLNSLHTFPSSCNAHYDDARSPPSVYRLTRLLVWRRRTAVG